MVANSTTFRLPALRYDHATAWALAVTGNLLGLLVLSLPRDEAVPLAAPARADPALIVAEIVPAAPAEPAPAPALPVPPKPRPLLQPTVEAPRMPVPAEPVADLSPAPAESPGDPAPALTSAPLAPPAAAVAADGVRYRDAPAPAYPAASLRRGEQGTVMLRVRVGVDGRPLAVELAHGSGHRELDRAAQRQVLAHWRFVPAQRAGRAVEAWVQVPVVFRISGH